MIGFRRVLLVVDAGGSENFEFGLELGFKFRVPLVRALSL